MEAFPQNTLISDNSSLCQIDTKLASTLALQNIQQILKEYLLSARNHDGQGMPACVCARVGARMLERAYLVSSVM